MHHDLLDLVAGDPGIGGRADVQLELLHPPQRGQHRDGDLAARLVIEARPRPDRSPGVFHEEVLEVRVERRAAFRSARHMGAAEDGLAHSFAMLQPFAVAHFASPLVAAAARMGIAPYPPFWLPSNPEIGYNLDRSNPGNSGSAAENAA